MTTKEKLLQEIEQSPELLLEEVLNFLLFTKNARYSQPLDEDENEDDSIKTIREGLYQGWQEILIGKTRPVSQLWEQIDVD